MCTKEPAHDVENGLKNLKHRANTTERGKRDLNPLQSRGQACLRDYVTRAALYRTRTNDPAMTETR